MTPAPRLPPAHPDRILDCEMAAEDEFRSLADRIEAAPHNDQVTPVI